MLLRDFRVFVYKKSATLWLHPEPSRSEALQKLQAALQDAMPLCDAQRSSHGTFTPHVTVGHFESEEAALLARDQIIASGWQGVEFPVSEVVLMARSEGGGGQFEPRWRVRLGRSAGLDPSPARRLPPRSAGPDPSRGRREWSPQTPPREGCTGLTTR